MVKKGKLIKLERMIKVGKDTKENTVTASDREVYRLPEKLRRSLEKA